MDKRERTRRIKDQARALGFEAVGIAPLSAMPGEALEAWLARQYHGTMAYMERSPEKRSDSREAERSQEGIGQCPFCGFSLSELSS